MHILAYRSQTWFTRYTAESRGGHSFNHATRHPLASRLSVLLAQCMRCQRFQAQKKSSPSTPIPFPICETVLLERQPPTATVLKSLKTQESSSRQRRRLTNLLFTSWFITRWFHVKASSDYFTSRPATLGRIAIKHDYSRDTQCVK